MKYIPARLALPAARASKTPGSAVLLVLLAFTLFSGATTTRAAGSPPERMTYQGFLVDNNGAALAPTTPINYPVVFRIYDVSEGGVPLWSEQQIVTVDKGNFSVILGEGTAVTGESRPALSTVFLGATASERYVGLTVTIGANNLTLLPRLRLLPAPYTFLASQAVQLVNPSTGVPFVSLAAGETTISNNTRFGSEVFWGTGALMRNEQGGSLELGNSLVASAVPYIDFHYGKSAAQDFNVRLINDGDGKLSLLGGRLSFGGGLANTKLALWDNGGSGAMGFGIQGSQFRLHLNGSGDRFSFLNAPAGSEIMTVLGNGNVGINAINPTHKLEVAGPNEVAWFSSSGANAYIRVSDNTGFNNRVEFASRGNGRAAIWSGADHLNVLQNGNIGIGTTVPNRKLDITGGNDGITIGQQSDNSMSIQAYIDGQWNNRATYAPSENRLLLQPDAGRVGIGTTTPAYLLSIRTTDLDQARLRVEHNSNYADFGRWANYLLVQLNNGVHSAANRFASYDGDSNWDFNSDRKLKKDIVDAEPMLDRALKVQVRRYRWNEDASDATHKLGVIAQEVQPLFPEMVNEVEPPDKRGEKVLTVGYGDFAVIAIKAIQELNEIVEAKDVRITALERELTALKQQVAANGEANTQWEARFSALEKRVAASAQPVGATQSASRQPR